MHRIPVAQLLEHAGAEALVAGFVTTTRVQKSMIFVILQDRTGSVQITLTRAKPGAAPAPIEQVGLDLTIGSAISVRGTVVKNTAVKAGGVELLASHIEVEGRAQPGLPVDEHSAPELQLDWRFLSLRRPENLLVFEVQTTVERAMRAHWAQHAFIELHSPKLMHSASESGAETFATRYFELGTAYLAQSPQFYKQMAIAAGFERVFEIAPVFRAEPSLTPRHAAEFTSVDVELSWIASHEDVMRFEEAWLAQVLATVRAEHGTAIERQFGVEVRQPAIPFPRLTMEEAHGMVRRLGHTPAPGTKSGDLDPESERLLARWALQEHGTEFLFLTDYPASLRPFYHMRYPDRPSVTRSFDLLWKGVEITTGAQREHRHAELARQAHQAGLGDSVAYYLDFFRYGCPPHGGFGLGLARLIMLMLGLPSIREAAFLHRSPNRLTP
jgi:aspartyl-tRNA synthetase